MARKRPQPRGWYVKEGDPPGMERFWDGEKWGPQPRQMKNPPAAKTRPGRRGDKAPVRKPVPTEAGDEGTDEMAAGEDVEWPRGTLLARITARSTDALILLLPWYLLFDRSYTVESETVTTTNDVYLWLTALLVVGYEAIFTGLWGWTPGKRLVGLAIIDPATGDSPGWGKAVMRATPLVLVVAVLPIPLLWLACVLAIRFDKKQRSVFDFTAGTIVIAVPRSR